MPRQRRHIYFSGTVQGVGFRYTAQRIATRHGLAGYVRNTSDGRVELLAEGESDDIDAMLRDLGEQMGPCIRNVDQQTAEPAGQFHDFRIRP